jgi:hypothetical protein
MKGACVGRSTFHRRGIRIVGRGRRNIASARPKALELGREGTIFPISGVISGFRPRGTDRGLGNGNRDVGGGRASFLLNTGRIAGRFNAGDRLRTYVRWLQRVEMSKRFHAAWLSLGIQRNCKLGSRSMRSCLLPSSSFRRLANESGMPPTFPGLMGLQIHGMWLNEAGYWKLFSVIENPASWLGSSHEICGSRLW